ncbi:Protein C04F6.7 [Aphelenchoides avenae]|nr:Protein C04F6.7 [Aphelenchus avenae]
MPNTEAEASSFPQNQLDGLESGTLLADSGLTYSWLLDTLRKHCSEFRKTVGEGKVLEIDSKDISKGQGFFSKVYKTVIHLSGAPAASFTVMAKVAIVSHSIVDERHNVECNVYDMLHGTDGLSIPSVWYTQKISKDSIGVILMNDLSPNNVCIGLMASLNCTQVKNANRYLAALHKHILCLTDVDQTRWENIELTGKERLERYGSESHLSVFNKVPEYQTDEFRSLIDKIRPAMSKEFALYALQDRPKQLGLPIVLCHGDAGPRNMFFKKAPDGTASNEIGAFFDWQVAFKGNPMVDICRILYTFCDPEVRREVEETLVEDYYKHLKEDMQKAGRSLDFTMEQLREAYALAAVHQTVDLSIRMPFFLGLKKNEFTPSVFEALRAKQILRAKFALIDATAHLEKHAPQYLAE